MTAAGALRELHDADVVAGKLAAAGIAGERAGVVRRQLLACAGALRQHGASSDDAALAFVVPGRIEVLGKHTDYAGGRSILAAPERGCAIVAVPRDDGQVGVHDVARGESIRFDLDPTPRSADGWANYPMTAARRLARNFPAARTGADLAVTSDLPVAAGMSSSSALIVAVFSALVAVNRVDEDERYRSAIATPEDLAGYLSTVENGLGFRTLQGDFGVGTEGGSEDHTAMLCARPGRLVQYTFGPVRLERELPLPPAHRFVIASSGVRAEKSGAARESYNRAARLMRTAAELWRAETGRADATVGAVLDADPDAGGRLRAVLAAVGSSTVPPEALLARVEQFIAEDREIIPAAGDALLRGDLVAFGARVERSQALAERLLGNQTDETVHLARAARELGAAAASAFGAGFGGSVWALVADDAADALQERWRADYLSRFPRHAGAAEFFQSRAGPPMARVL